jgi:mycothiol system anti-sigma-R factor
MSIRACEHALEYVYQYLDGELSSSRRARIQWHLRKCDECSPVFDFEANLKQAIRKQCHDDPPPELLDRLRTLIREEDLGQPEF